MRDAWVSGRKSASNADAPEACSPIASLSTAAVATALAEPCRTDVALCLLRAAADPSESWTAKLMAQGVKRIAQKVGEEGVETALAGVAGPDEELASEAADLIYHLLVLLHARNMVFQDVLDVLASRAEAGKAPG